MSKKIIVTGAAGLIGRNLCRILAERGDEITVFTRNPDGAKKKLPFVKEFVKWDTYSSADYSEYIDGKDAVIHLAGASVAGSKWTESYKKEILSSRIVSTKTIVDSIANCKNKPDVLVCSSAIGFYGSTNDDIITEASPAGDDFLAGVCKEWERTACKVESFGVRRVSIRTGIVLDKNGGALSKMLTPFRLFAGGPLGSGHQWFSWIHWRDLCRIYIYALDDKYLNGEVNAVSPNPITMYEFAECLGRVMNRPSVVNIPEFVLRILLGEGADAVLASQRVIPQKLQNAGFKFEFTQPEEALKDILNK